MSTKKLTPEESAAYAALARAARRLRRAQEQAREGRNTGHLQQPIPSSKQKTA
jgi:hypothetical protein